MSNVRKQYTEDQIGEVRARVLAYKELNSLSWPELTAKTGIPVSTIQAFATGNYKGDNAKIATEVERWFSADAEMELFAADEITAPFYQKTKTAMRIRSQLVWAKRGNMITVMGNPGVGKTEAINAFRREFPNVWHVTAAPSRANYSAILQEVLRDMNVAAGKRTTFQLSEVARRQFRARDGAVLIIDEAQHLNEKALEELRSIHDDTKVGMVFAGNLEVTRNIEGTGQANFAQRFSRISMRQIILVPEREDVDLLLSHWGITDPRQAQFLTDIAMRMGGGALRSMTKCLELAHVIARDLDNRAPVSLTHIKDAWAQLSAGAAS